MRMLKSCGNCKVLILLINTIGMFRALQQHNVSYQTLSDNKKGRSSMQREGRPVSVGVS